VTDRSERPAWLDDDTDPGDPPCGPGQRWGGRQGGAWRADRAAVAEARRLLAGELTPEDREHWLAVCVGIRDNQYAQPLARRSAATLIEREAERMRQRAEAEAHAKRRDELDRAAGLKK
jgi:hypothetical protein